jgi:ATP adenylyltransferase
VWLLNVFKVCESRWILAIDRIYTPWRLKYVTSQTKKEGCVFCNTLKDEVTRDRENFIVYRGETCFVMMNIYPYNVGHLMIMPRLHTSKLAGLPRQTQLELMLLTTYFTELLEELMHPDGFNVGVNIGKAAGAGIDSHLHVHVVPRWQGDSNFMPVIGETRVLPEELTDTYDKIVRAIQQTGPPAI